MKQKNKKIFIKAGIPCNNNRILISGPKIEDKETLIARMLEDRCVNSSNDKTEQHNNACNEEFEEFINNENCLNQSGKYDNGEELIKESLRGSSRLLTYLKMLEVAQSEKEAYNIINKLIIILSNKIFRTSRNTTTFRGELTLNINKVKESVSELKKIEASVLKDVVDLKNKLESIKNQESHINDSCIFEFRSGIAENKIFIEKTQQRLYNYVSDIRKEIATAKDDIEKKISFIKNIHADKEDSSNKLDKIVSWSIICIAVLVGIILLPLVYQSILIWFKK